MLELLLASALVWAGERPACPVPTVVVPDGQVPDVMDLRTLGRAAPRCAELFPDYPCLRKLIVIYDPDGSRRYRVHCDKEEEKA